MSGHFVFLFHSGHQRVGTSGTSGRGPHYRGCDNVRSSSLSTSGSAPSPSPTAESADDWLSNGDGPTDLE